MINELKERILVLDGATGTAIYSYKLTEDDFRGEILKGHPTPLKGCHGLLNITRPDVIREIHQKYIAAGADIIETNTFNCNGISLEEYGIKEMVFQLVKAGAETAGAVADEHFKKSGKKIFTAGSIGPASKSLSRGQITFDELKNIYLVQIGGVIAGGVDCLLIETIYDRLNAEAALSAAEELFFQRGESLPVMPSMTVNNEGKIFSGESVEEVIYKLDREYVISFGINCSSKADDLVPIVKRIKNSTGKYVSLYPNAGLPDENGEYKETPEMMAASMKELVDEGLVNIIGGCCGTNYEHIKAIASMIK